MRRIPGRGALLTSAAVLLAACSDATGPAPSGRRAALAEAGAPAPVTLGGPRVWRKPWEPGLREVGRDYIRGRRGAAPGQCRISIPGVAQEGEVYGQWVAERDPDTCEYIIARGYHPELQRDWEERAAHRARLLGQRRVGADASVGSTSSTGEADSVVVSQSQSIALYGVPTVETLSERSWYHRRVNTDSRIGYDTRHWSMVRVVRNADGSGMQRARGDLRVGWSRATFWRPWDYKVLLPFRSKVGNLTQQLTVLNFSKFEDVDTPLCHGVWTSGGPLAAEYFLETGVWADGGVDHVIDVYEDFGRCTTDFFMGAHFLMNGYQRSYYVSHSGPG